MKIPILTTNDGCTHALRSACIQLVLGDIECKSGNKAYTAVLIIHELTCKPMQIVYDDYNSRIQASGVMGTITTQFGDPAFRHGTKLIEIYAKDSNWLE